MAIEEPQFPTPETPAVPPVVSQAEAVSLPLDPLTLLTPAPAAQEMPAVLPAEEITVPQVLPAAAPPHPGFWWGILWCMGFLFVTQIIPGIVVPLIIIFYRLMGTPSNLMREKLRDSGWVQGMIADSMPQSFFVAEVMVIVFSLLVIRFVVGPDWKRQLGVRRPSLSQFILVLISLAPMVILAQGIYLVASRNLPGMKDLGMQGMEELVQKFRTWPPAFGALVIGLGPGIGEELWCRGFLGRGFVGRYGVVVGVLLTSFFFGAIHIDPPQGTMAMLMGIFLHYVYLTTRSLWMPMLLHFLNNAVSVLAGHFANLSFIDTEPEKIPAVVFWAAAFLLGALTWAFYQGRTRLAVFAEDGLVSWRPDFPSVEYPPADRITVVNRPWPGWLASSFVLVGLFGFAACSYLALLQS
jgi:membrane protease YdiL (CAAX protease family)